MKLDQARHLLAVLSVAIGKAEAAGSDNVDFGSELQAAVDAARSDLEASIKRAEGG